MNWTFETGKLYTLRLINNGVEKHELDASAITNKAFTRKVQIVDKAGNIITEVKG